MSFPVPASLAALAFLITTGCSAPAAAPATGTAEDEQAIRGLADKYAAAFTARDTAAFRTLVTSDYQDVDPTGKHTQGADAVVASVAAEMATMPAGMTVAMKTTTTYVTFIDATHAVAGGTFEVTPAMPGTNGKGAWMAVAAKEGSDWKMMSALGAGDMTPMMQDATKKP